MIEEHHPGCINVKESELSKGKKLIPMLRHRSGLFHSEEVPISRFCVYRYLDNKNFYVYMIPDFVRRVLSAQLLT